MRLLLSLRAMGEAAMGRMTTVPVTPMTVIGSWWGGQTVGGSGFLNLQSLDQNQEHFDFNFFLCLG